jgi:2-amino-4-hydroxy-6-hydroxymethyldihydropteridine diphosphokinase
LKYFLFMAESRIAYLSAGANLGDRRAALIAAVQALSGGGRVRRVSAMFETEPVGYRDQPWFLNIAVEIETGFTPRELLAACLEIEARHGRVRTFAGAPRTLDIDILLHGDLVVDQPDLQIPHPRMTDRRFVLMPLAEIAPDAIHPVHRLSIAVLLARCQDASAIRRVSEFPHLSA